MRKHIILVVLPLLGVLIHAVQAQTQVIRQDTLDGGFQIAYEGSDGLEYSVFVESRDKVAPVLRVVIDRRDRHWAFQYTLQNDMADHATQMIFSFNLPCLTTDETLTVDRPNGWRFRAPTPRRPFCSFVGGVGRMIEVGGSQPGFTVESGLFPAIVEVRLQGLTTTPPLTSAEDTPDAVSRLITQIRGIGPGGSFAVVHAIGPARSLEGFRDPVYALTAAKDDLDESCGLSWIANPGICNSLRTKLEQAGRALERGRNEAAVGQLQAFLNELEAQHGEEPGKHVNDNAYWLLKVNVEFILERMAAGEA